MDSRDIIEEINEGIQEHWMYEECDLISESYHSTESVLRLVYSTFSKEELIDLLINQGEQSND